MDFISISDEFVIDQFLNDVLCSQEPLSHYRRVPSLGNQQTETQETSEQMDISETISDISLVSSSNSSMSSDPEVSVSDPEAIVSDVSSPEKQTLPMPSPSNDVVPPSQCQICMDGKAGKHVYYGGRGSCLSCRAFFRRSVQSQQFELFVCPADRVCIIMSKSRKSCQWCRFQKCLGSGMKPRWVLDDKQRKELLVKRNKTRAKAVVRMCGRPKVVSRPVQPNAMVMTKDELEFLTKMTTEIDREILDISAKLCCRSGSITNKVLDAFFTDKKLTYQEIKTCEIIDTTSMHIFFSKHEDMQVLKDSDRKALIAQNSQAYLGMIYAAPRVTMDQQATTEFINFLREHSSLDIKTKIQRYEDLNIQPVFEYDQLYHSPWAASLADEEEHLSLSKKMTVCLMDSSQLKADNVFLGLLSLVILFSSDSADLQEKAKIEAIQSKYLFYLYKYLKHMYKSQANKKLSSGLMISSYGKSAFELHQKMLPL